MSSKIADSLLAAAAISLTLGGGAAEAALVASYNFNEGSGTTANPSVGAIDGTLQGGASFVASGIEGGAVSLANATNDLVNFGESFPFTSGSFSIQIWVKTTDTGASVPVAKHHSGNVSGYFVAINDVADACGGSGGYAHFYVAYPCSGNSSTVVNDGNWHQLVGIYDSGTAKSSIYVDGVFQSASVGGNVVNPTPAGTDFLLGGIMSGGVATNMYSGLLDDLYIYDNALTDDQVRALYTATITPPVIPAPEPATLALFGASLAGLVLGRRRMAKGLNSFKA